MKSKVLLMLLALMVLSMPFQEQRALAVTAKVATVAARKMVQEVVKDTAKEKAFMMALDEVGKIYDPNNTYKFKEGYHGYCVEVKKPDGTCTKPIQIKSEITDADKIEIDRQVANSMDTKLAGTLYSNKWGKFLDWFIPVYLVSGAGVFIDYAINQEDSIAGMMSEIAMESLQAAGVIAPAETLRPNIVDQNGVIMDNTETEVIQKNTADSITKTYDNKDYEIYHNVAGSHSTTINVPEVEEYSMVWQRETTMGARTPATTVYADATMIGLPNYIADASIQDGKIQMVGFRGQNTVWKNGDTKVYEGSEGIRNIIIPDSEIIKGETMITDVIVNLKKGYPEPNSQSMPKTQGVYLTYVYLSNGDYYKLESKHEDWASIAGAIRFSDYVRTNEKTAIKVQIYPYGKATMVPFVPNWQEDVYTMQEIPLDSSFYKQGDYVKLPPIDSLTYVDADGNPLEIQRDANGNLILTNPDGTEVPDEQVIVQDGTGIVTNPSDGTITYTPGNPSPENPTQEPVTVPKENSTTPPPTTPPGTNEPPLEPFPEGESCDAKLQFPIFSPLKEQLSTSFPFSIPWDIERAAHAAFDGVGNEKPSFEMVIPVGDDKHNFEITTPAFLDDWKPFMDGFLLLTFDLLLMFGLYRFVKGAGS